MCVCVCVFFFLGSLSLSSRFPCLIAHEPLLLLLLLLCLTVPVRYLDIALPHDVEDDSKCSALRDRSGLLRITMPVKPPVAPAPTPKPPAAPASGVPSRGGGGESGGGAAADGGAADDDGGVEEHKVQQRS